ncbi:MAG: T9SS type A sorting domain-containing protein, partial [Flavobacteriales bacterium]
GKNVVSVYPNPVKSQLVVNTEENIKSIVIVDIMGKSTTASLSTKSTIDFSDFTNGVYFLQVKTDNALITKKIIKQ